jgi:uncharacterized protein YndB with AHSA1/START domain
MADVVDTSPAGFTVRTVVTIARPPAQVYAMLLEVGRWWDPEHTWSGDASNLRLDARAGGCFCEALPSGGSVQHAVVVHVEPGKLLRLSGALGPLQSMGVSGSLTWEIAPEGNGSRATVTYAVGGYLPGGPGALAPAVDQVVGGQLRRLERILGSSR